MNQRIHEIDEVESTFVYPNMGDGGCGTGLAMLLSWPGGVKPSSATCTGGRRTRRRRSSRARQERPRLRTSANLVQEIARRITAARSSAFRRPHGVRPRALGNRSILYHAREPEVNQWLNKRLGRTEFMPFAPVTCGRRASAAT